MAKVKSAADQAAKGNKGKSEKKYYVLVDKKGKDCEGPGPFHNRTPAGAAKKAVTALSGGKEVEVRLRERGRKNVDGSTTIRVFKGKTEQGLYDKPIFPGQKPDGAGKFPAKKAIAKFTCLEYLKA
jgi:hypothetical protein